MSEQLLVVALYMLLGFAAWRAHTRHVAFAMALFLGITVVTFVVDHGFKLSVYVDIAAIAVFCVIGVLKGRMPRSSAG